jgi:hypothetical protein
VNAAAVFERERAIIKSQEPPAGVHDVPIFRTTVQQKLNGRFDGQKRPSFRTFLKVIDRQLGYDFSTGRFLLADREGKIAECGFSKFWMITQWSSQIVLSK